MLGKNTFMYHLINSPNQRLHRTNFRCHLLCKNTHKSFGFNHDLLKEWGKESVNKFIKGCADLYSKKSNELAMVFYAWYDEQAGQIRISAVSQIHGKLPFKCKLNDAKLCEVVNGLYAEDSGRFTKGELDVWQQNI